MRRRHHGKLRLNMAARVADLGLVGTLDGPLGTADAIADGGGCQEREDLSARGKKLILQGGENHAVTGHSFVADPVPTCARSQIEEVTDHQEHVPPGGGLEAADKGESRCLTDGDARTSTSRFVRGLFWSRCE